ncbi:MAG TPA: hypothetical protein VMP68_08290 [Candidatus Eisenbacteria bacterium]|nr:hypothetical protein [Candidatus Eisenbacteria bacterium]
MRSFVFAALLFVCLVAVQVGNAQSITWLSETSNNTSACSAAGSPSYCVEALPSQVTSLANQQAGAQTTTIDAFPGQVSSVQIGELMNTTSQNWTGKVLCEYQPWFSTQSQINYNGHIVIGYDENTLATVTKQDSDMISRGCNINFIDCYGATNHSFKSDEQQQRLLRSCNAKNSKRLSDADRYSRRRECVHGAVYGERSNP